MEGDLRQNEVTFVTVPDVLGILMFTLVLIVIAKSVGLYLYAVYDTRQTWLDPLMCAVERRGTAGVKDNHEMPWTEYFLAILTFNLIGFVVLYTLLRVQAAESSPVLVLK